MRSPSLRTLPSRMFSTFSFSPMARASSSPPLSEGRSAPDHAQGAHLGQVADQFFGDAVGKIFHVAGRTQICEWHDRYGLRWSGSVASDTSAVESCGAVRNHNR